MIVEVNIGDPTKIEASAKNTRGIERRRSPRTDQGTATRRHQRWFNIVDLDHHYPSHPLPRPSQAHKASKVSNYFYNFLHMLLTNTHPRYPRALVNLRRAASTLPHLADRSGGGSRLSWALPGDEVKPPRGSSPFVGM